MAATPASIRVQFPELSADMYSDAQMLAWIVPVEQLVNKDRWGALYDFGVTLAVAHFLAVNSSSGASTSGARRARSPGKVGGILTSKSADGVSASYDVSSVVEENGGHWNLTTYGLQYLRLSRMMGAGPIQIGVPNGLTPHAYQMPWYGPPTALS